MIDYIGEHLWLLTLIPFLVFVGFLVRFEIKFRRRDNNLHQDTERFMRPIAKTAGQLFEKQYGRPSTDIERAFPEIREAK